MQIIWAFFRHVLYIYTYSATVFNVILKKKVKIRLIVWYIIHTNIVLKTGGGLTVSCVGTERIPYVDRAKLKRTLSSVCMLYTGKI